MITTPFELLTFSEYLNYSDEGNRLYEWENGALIVVNPPSLSHALIIRLLINQFEGEIARLMQPWLTLSMVGVRTAINRSRVPDLMVVTREQVDPLGPAVLESAPLLVVEVVSPESRVRDYRYKRSEYSVVGIGEYWIVDPQDAKVTVLFLEEGFYELTEFTSSDQIVSRLFPHFSLTAQQVLQG